MCLRLFGLTELILILHHSKIDANFILLSIFSFVRLWIFCKIKLTRTIWTYIHILFKLLNCWLVLKVLGNVINDIVFVIFTNSIFIFRLFEKGCLLFHSGPNIPYILIQTLYVELISEIPHSWKHVILTYAVVWIHIKDKETYLFQTYLVRVLVHLVGLITDKQFIDCLIECFVGVMIAPVKQVTQFIG